MNLCNSFHRGSPLNRRASNRRGFSVKSLGLFAALLVACLAIDNRPVQAQAVHGINSDARDFYIAYMPPIYHGLIFSTTLESYYALICSYSDNNTVSISYFDASGAEFQGSTKTIGKGRGVQILLPRIQLAPTRPGEVLEFKAAHIKSKYPVSVQCYDEGSSSGGMYQAIPTSALGKSYVIASWFDNPLQNNPGSLNRDSSSSEFMIVAPYNNTNVTFVPNSTTNAQVLGYNSGVNSDGKPHPTTINMQKGQVYWVRSWSEDASNDLSGSTVVADKPIAVLGGQERGLLGDPSGWWISLDNDIRDVMVEQMTPVDDWGSDYPSIPFMPAAQVARLLRNGEGNMYRIFTNDPAGGIINRWEGTPPQAYQAPVSAYQSPAAQYNNIENPVDLLVDTKDATGALKKMYVVMYDYFQGQHQSSGGGVANGDGKGGEKTQGGGGDQTEDETTYKAPNEMDLVPIDRWRLTSIFKIPQNSTYRGYQFINIITNRDSLNNMTVMFNGLNKTPLKAMSAVKRYDLPLHPELTGLTLKLPAGDYVISGNTPFACYSYGRTETQYKDGWGYAAPCGQAYGSRSEPNAPKAEITPSCDHWRIHIHDTGPGHQEGIADLMLLNDPDGIYVKPAHVSFNTSLADTMGNTIDPVFVPGDTSIVPFWIVINDPTKDAYAALYIVDRAGNDTVIEFHYKAPNITLTQKNFDFKEVLVGTQVCSTFTLKVLSTGAGTVDTLGVPSWLLNDMSNYGPDTSNSKRSPTFSWTASRKLPAALHVGDSVVFTVCFAPTDTNNTVNLLDSNHRVQYGHADVLVTQVGCGYDTVYVRGKGVTPIILAGDRDFGNVAIGDAPCKTVRVQNIGNAPLILDKKWVLHVNPDYTFGDFALLPITLKPGDATNLNFCFHPTAKGQSNTQQDWGTNLPPEYAHLKKDTSLLTGRSIEPGLTWDRPKQGFTVNCDAIDTVRVYLLNPASSTDKINVETVKIAGPDAAEFTIVRNQLNHIPLQDRLPWPLKPGDSIWVVLQFKADLSKGYVNRSAFIFASGNGASTKTYTDTIKLFGTVRHAELLINPMAYDFGTWSPGTVLTKDFTITNHGDTDLVINSFGLGGGTNFTILRGPKIGDKIAPGGVDTFTVQFTAPPSGIISDTVNGASTFPTCAPNQYSYLRGSSRTFSVDGVGHDFKLNYICSSRAPDVYNVYTRNLSTMWSILKSVKIVDDTLQGNARWSDGSQFSFDNGRRLKVLGTPVAPDSIVPITISFKPTKRGYDTLFVQYVWTDTSRGTFDTTVSQMITAIGYQSGNILTVANVAPAATDTGQKGYTEVTKNNVTVPVRLAAAFTPTDSIFGVKFTLRYLRDQFIFQDAQLQPGLSWQGGVAPTPTPDQTDNNYELFVAHVTSTTPITNPQIMNGIWQYVIAKDSFTSFEIRDLAWLDQTGTPACWETDSIVSAPFYGTNNCGDYTLREYLKTGQGAFSISHIVPNPVTTSARFDFMVNESGLPVTIEVFNALGQKVQTITKDEVLAKGGYSRDFDATDLSSGMYTVRFSAPGTEVMKSLMVNK